MINMDKPLALDLCCGKGGWADGLLATGWDVLGVDVRDWGYPGHLVIQDVRTMDGARLRGRVSLVVASPPCHEFSFRSFPFKRCRYLRDNVPPDTSIWEACVRIAREAGAPLVLENVRGAVRYMGPPASRYGPFYLWGDGVPPFIPDGNGVRKGKGSGSAWFYQNGGNGRSANSKSKERAEWSAQAAKIPYELAHWIGTVHHPVFN